MTNRRTRRHPARPARTPLTSPVGRLEGWTLEHLADETGADSAQLLRLLIGEIAAGRVAEIRTGGRTLYARVGGGTVAEVIR